MASTSETATESTENPVFHRDSLEKSHFCPLYAPKTHAKPSNIGNKCCKSCRSIPAMTSKSKPRPNPQNSPGIAALGDLFTCRQLANLVPYAKNSRTHSAAQVKQIAALIDEFGFTNPMLADAAGNVHAGHGRMLGAELLYSQGKTIRLPGGQQLDPGTVPVLDCTGWTEAQRRAYVIADNRAALNAGWDAQLLGEELSALKAESFALDLLGFADDELQGLIGGGSTDAPTPSWGHHTSIPGVSALLGGNESARPEQTLDTATAARALREVLAAIDAGTVTVSKATSTAKGRSEDIVSSVLSLTLHHRRKAAII